MTNLIDLREKLERATNLSEWSMQRDGTIMIKLNQHHVASCWGGTAANTKLIFATLQALPHLLDLLNAKEVREREMREALRVSEAAMREYYRYFTGGETRGSYDGKPERNALWSAMHAARLALSAGAGADA